MLHPLELFLIIFCIAVIGFVIINYIYKKRKYGSNIHCLDCKAFNSGKKLVKMYHKKYKKKH